MVAPLNYKLTLYFSPLCIFGQLARLLCEACLESGKLPSTKVGILKPESMEAQHMAPENAGAPQVELIEVPFGLPNPYVNTIYGQTPTLLVYPEFNKPEFTSSGDQKEVLISTPLIIEDFRMIWYELYGRFLPPASHYSERSILDTRTAELVHTVIAPLLTSPDGSRILKESFGGVSRSGALARKRFLYRYWTAPLLLHRLKRKSVLFSTEAACVDRFHAQRHVHGGEPSESGTAVIIERAASAVLNRFTTLRETRI